MRTIIQLQILTCMAILAAGILSPVQAQDETLAGELAEPLSSMPDDAFITLTGMVEEIGVDEFKLDYGVNEITVELDRFGWTGNEALYLIPGESVTVRGFIDDDLFEGREIEAYSVLLNDSYMYYYTADADPYFYIFDRSLEDGTLVTLTGEVTEISGGKFTVTNAKGSTKVDTDELEYDPFDEEGLQKIDMGDKVYVYGEVDDDFLETVEIDARGVIEMVSTE